jgi:hypothetical protein
VGWTSIRYEYLGAWKPALLPENLVHAQERRERERWVALLIFAEGVRMGFPAVLSSRIGIPEDSLELSCRIDKTIILAQLGNLIYKNGYKFMRGRLRG